MIRLGFAVRAVGRPGLAAGGGRGAPPHLSVALARLADMLAYLGQIGVGLYRAALALPPSEGFTQLAACAPQLEVLAARLAAQGVRVTVHLPLEHSLATADEAHAAAATASIEATAALLAALDARRPPGPAEGVMVAHLGAPAADTGAARRFAARYLALSARARARLAIEHEGAGPSLGRLLELHQACGVPVVFDALHHDLHNPEGLPLGLALGLALATWPPGVRPKAHLSTPRSEAHLLPGRAGEPPRVVPPRPGQHADFVAAGDLERLLLAARGLPPFDLMLEAKAGDLALARLRAEIARRAPGLATRLS
ncbi:MAG: UV damage endonuclease UvsE [Chloroflexales bacterium]|nr:UV damage endonuclease UvsE [Chloroflexales bacterium]